MNAIGPEHEPENDTAERDRSLTTPAMKLVYSAISDVGRVRRDNQDSGYAGPWFLGVCDGVGGSARGDIASSTAVAVLRRLDEATTEDPLGRIAGALHRAHDRLAELVEEDPALSGTSTTATVALFDGRQLGLGHVGDSRAYLWRGGEIRQLTHDHTFVQGLVDEGRITEEESRTHPHRNLILKALDGVHDPAPDLFSVPLQEGDRLLLCSDGASGVLTAQRLGEILGRGTPDHAAVELVRASLEAGSSDNVTCVVADVVADTDPAADDLSPLLVGAAAELPRRSPLEGPGGHHTTSTSTGSATDGGSSADGRRGSGEVDAETARYAPRPPRQLAWLRHLLATLIVLGIAWMGLSAAWWWTQQQFFVGESDGAVTVFRGINADVPGIDLSHPFESSDVQLDRLSDYDAEQVRSGMEADDLDDAREIVDNLAAQQVAG